MLQPLTCLRVFYEPRLLFVHAAQHGGPRLLFALQTLELMLMHPKLWVSALMRAPGAPAIAVMTLFQALINQVAGPLLLILAVAAAYNALARMRGRGADMWAVMGALSLAWVPHTLGVALIALWHRLAAGPAQPSAAILLFAPGLYGSIALWTLWQQGSIKTAPSVLTAPSPKAWTAALTAGFVLSLASLATLWHLHSRWDVMRPKLAGDLLLPIELDGVNTGHLSSRDLAGHVTLVDFWATWCGPCMQAMPELERLHRDYQGQGLRVVAVNIEAGNKASIESLIATQHLSLPIYLDTSNLAEQMQVQVYPTSFLVDAQGRIVHVYSGPADGRDLEARIVHLLQRAKAQELAPS